LNSIAQSLIFHNPFHHFIFYKYEITIQFIHTS